MPTSTPEALAGTRWSYGTVWERYPVRHGELWGVGRHFFAAGDLQEGAAVAFLGHPDVPPAVMGYADLPWNPGVATQFRRKAGIDERADWKGLLRAVCESALHVGGPSFFEVGHDQAPRLWDAGEATGLVVSAWNINEPPNKMPARLLRMVPPSLRAQVPLQEPVGKTGLDAPTWAIERHSKPGQAVFDCCVGRGLTAMEAHRLGRTALGLELNPRRLAVTLHLLAENRAGTPRCVGRIDLT